MSLWQVRQQSLAIMLTLRGVDSGGEVEFNRVEFVIV